MVKLMSPEKEITFIQLSREDCEYLLELIENIDFDIQYTERQRGFTVPKLKKIKNDPYSARLAYQDVEYLLDLIEDDTDPSYENQREATMQTILKIQELQKQKFTEISEIERQRELRRSRRTK